METTENLQKETLRTASVFELEQERKKYLNRHIYKVIRIDYDEEEWQEEEEEIGFFGDDFKGTASLGNGRAKAIAAIADIEFKIYIHWNDNGECEWYPRFKVVQITVE